jgi:hypothetical protein
MLSMVAYGMAEAMDPDEAMMMGVMKMMEPLKEQIEAAYPDMSGANLQGVIDMFMTGIQEVMGEAPPYAIEMIRQGISEAGSFDELWNMFKKAYVTMAKQSQHM